MIQKANKKGKAYLVEMLFCWTPKGTSVVAPSNDIQMTYQSIFVWKKIPW